MGLSFHSCDSGFSGVYYEKRADGEISRDILSNTIIVDFLLTNWHVNDTNTVIIIKVS